MLAHSLFTFIGNDSTETAGSLKLVDRTEDVAKPVQQVVVRFVVAEPAGVVLEHFERAD
jgi:hypothetical protein